MCSSLYFILSFIWFNLIDSDPVLQNFTKNVDRIRWLANAYSISNVKLVTGNGITCNGFLFRVSPLNPLTSMTLDWGNSAYDCIKL